jgi:hypothetical protein
MGIWFRLTRLSPLVATLAAQRTTRADANEHAQDGRSISRNAVRYCPAHRAPTSRVESWFRYVQLIVAKPSIGSGYSADAPCDIFKNDRSGKLRRLIRLVVLSSGLHSLYSRAPQIS